MIFISHRGNIDKINVKEENKPTYIFNALDQNYDVEVDIWFINTKRIWFHAKNIEAFYELLKRDIVCFWHQNDDVTLTSNGYIWTYPGKQLTSNSICVLPEQNNIKKFNCAGICSDFIIKYSKAQN